MIQIQNVNFKYKEGKEILKDINLQIKEGEFISIIGKNGSGKSTLARLIAAITEPTAGSITIDEIDTKDAKKFFDIRKKIGMVFQNPESQIIFGKVYDDMAFALKNLKMNQIEERIKTALQKVEMETYEQKESFALSLGQKQRITIASVLAVDTPYLVLDEPTAMLDPKGKDEIYKIIQELKKQGYTIIYITNVIDEILLSDKIIIMEDGKIAHTFYKTEIMEHIQEIEECDIKIPTIVRTVIELEKSGIKIKPKEWTLEELIKEIVTICKKEAKREVEEKKE